MQIAKPLTIFGGTFDPVHNGHLYLAQQIIKQFAIEQVRFLPCYQPVHRIAMASPADRLAMLQLAISDQKNVCMDEREIKRQAPSYMIDTLISFRNEFPNHPLYLLMATDAFAKFDTWYRWQDILQYTHIILVQRPDFALSSENNILNEFLATHKTSDKTALAKKLNGYIYMSNIIGLPISSTMIRKKIAAGEPVRDLIPEKVWSYILNHQLYGAAT